MCDNAISNAALDSRCCSMRRLQQRSCGIRRDVMLMAYAVIDVVYFGMRLVGVGKGSAGFDATLANS